MVLPKDMISSMQTKFKLLKCNKFILGITTAIQLSISHKYKKLNLLSQLMPYQALLYGDHGIIGNLVLKWFFVQKVTCIGLRFKFLQDIINTNSIVLRQIPGKPILQKMWILMEIINSILKVESLLIKMYAIILKVLENKFHTQLTNTSNIMSTFVSTKMMWLSSSEKDKIMKAVSVSLLTYQLNPNRFQMELNCSARSWMHKFGFKVNSLCMKDISSFLKSYTREISDNSSISRIIRKKEIKSL